MANEVNCDGPKHGSGKEIECGERIFCQGCYDMLLDRISDLEDEVKDLTDDLETSENRVGELEEQLDEIADAKKEL